MLCPRNFSNSLPHNRGVTDSKAKNIKRSFWCIVATVIFFSLFIVSFAINESIHLEKKADELKASTAIIYNKGVPKMSDDSNHTDTTQQVKTEKPDTTKVKPNMNIVAPEFEISTESFDPSKLKTNQKEK